LYEAAGDDHCDLWITKGYAHNLSWRHKDYHQRLVEFFSQHL
jgi:hypothetical protein